MKTYHTINTTCVGCETTVQLDEPLCLPDDKLTAQCTDQCVVIACDDPDHAATMCKAGGMHAHCDLVCDEGLDCTDCIGFDAFLRCCDEDRPYNAEPPRQVSPLTTSLSSTSAVWAAVLQEWCAACGEVEPSKAPETYARPIAGPSTSYSTDREMHQSDIHHTQPSFQADSVEAAAGSSFSTDSGANHSVDSETYRPQIHDQSFSMHTDPQTPKLATKASLSSEFSCMWAACQASFSALSDLVNHVNHNHLATTPTLDNKADVSEHSGDHCESSVCLWGNCDSSYYFSARTADQFMDHLMNVHLGSNAQLDFGHHGQHYQQQQHLQQHQEPHQHCHAHDQQPEASSSRQHDRSVPPPNFLSDTNHDQMDMDESLSQNTANIHTCAGAHECRWKDCAQSFHSCDDLTTHINDIHIGGGKAHYECFWDQCARNGSQGFQSKQKICRHVQSHTGHRPFQCSICQQNFSEAATLQQHIRRHTQEKPYVCDHPGCSKSFAITGALTIHKRTHNGDKPFKCTYCDRGFAESSNLSKHLRTHTGARPYTCPEPGCNKAFARPDQLNRHKGVHKKQIRGIGGQALVE